MTRAWRIALLVAATALSFGVFFAVAKATDSGNSATAPRPPAVPPALTGDASLGRAASLPALKPAAKRRRKAAPAPAPTAKPEPKATEQAPATPVPSAPTQTPVAPVAPAPAPQRAPRPAPKPAPVEDFDDSG